MVGRRQCYGGAHGDLWMSEVGEELWNLKLFDTWMLRAEFVEKGI